MTDEFHHIPVLLSEAVKGLNIKSAGIYADGTLGGGGHSEKIASLLDGGRLIATDRDPEAIRAAGKRLQKYSDRITLVHDNFGNLPKILDDLGIKAVDGILLDLGVSSHQLDVPERGFSYMADEARLDMRMDQSPSNTFDAAFVLNTYGKDELARILKEYGEERFASRIAGNIVSAREKEPLETVGQLNRIIRESIPEKARRTGGNPSKRTFQALRIEVNSELSVLSDSIENLIELLSDKGRIAVITFHSLEDRIVKEAFRKAENPCTCPPEFPECVCGKKPKGFIVTKKPITPGQEEEAENSRAKSAKLRIFERRLA